jgi:hypothetical protein
MGSKEPKTAWKKGQSGNPRGRLPDEELACARAAARKLILPYAADLVQSLVDIARRGRSESARIHAATALLDRLYGKAPQSVELTGKDGGPVQARVDFDRLTNDQLRELVGIVTALGDEPKRDR